MAFPETGVDTLTDDSLGRVKTDKPGQPLEDLTWDVPAEEYNRVRQAIVALETTVGLPDGSTSGSAWEAILSGRTGSQVIAADYGAGPYAVADTAGIVRVNVTGGDGSPPDVTVALPTTGRQLWLDVRADGSDVVRAVFTGAIVDGEGDANINLRAGLWLAVAEIVGGDAGVVWVVRRIVEPSELLTIDQVAAQLGGRTKVAIYSAAGAVDPEAGAHIVVTDGITITLPESPVECAFWVVNVSGGDATLDGDGKLINGSPSITLPGWTYGSIWTSVVFSSVADGWIVTSLASRDELAALTASQVAFDDSLVTPFVTGSTVQEAIESAAYLAGNSEAMAVGVREWVGGGSFEQDKTIYVASGTGYTRTLPASITRPRRYVVFYTGAVGESITIGRNGANINGAAADYVIHGNGATRVVEIVGLTSIATHTGWRIQEFASYAELAAHVGSGGTAHAVATPSAAGFMSTAQATTVSKILFSSGSPEGVTSGNVGMLYSDETNGILYEKRTGTGNAGWARISRCESGTYTPTATVTSNLDSITPDVAHWVRVGNEVTVDGLLSYDPTASAPVGFRLSLPVASNFTATTDAVGSGNAGTGTIIAANATNDDVDCTFANTSTTSVTRSYSFTYTVK